ncbi:MAG: ABC transporter ATP-binding protein, partial [Dehalococcoidia bacterium]
LGLLKPTSGRIELDGTDLVADPAYGRRVIGFLPQSQVTMDSIHVDEFIHHVGLLRGLSRAEARAATEGLIERLHLAEFRHTRMFTASGGVRRLAGFAAAVVSQPRLVVLDEPTNDVDPVRRQTLWGMVDQLGAGGTTVLLVTHNLAEAERVLDRFAIIDAGRILREGTTSALRGIVSDQVRLDISGPGEFLPHPALVADPGLPGRYLFEEQDLGEIALWVSGLRSQGLVADYRIGPPTLDDIYTAVVGRPLAAEEAAA